MFEQLLERRGSGRHRLTCRRLPQWRRRSLSLLLGVCTLAAPYRQAWAFKWRACPVPPLPVYPSALGATSAPFIHPGHLLTLVLNQDEVETTGGFSLQPDGNRVAVTFASLFGVPVPLPHFAVTANSPSALTFSFPDTQQETGRILSGPVAVRIFARRQLVADIRASDLVALPPATDVTDLLLGDDPEQVVLVALGADGDLWVPARFHGAPKSMPTCPGNFIMPMPLQVAGAAVAGGLPSAYNPLAHICGVVGYLGDVVVNDIDFYGMLYPQRINLVHVAGTLGVSICRLNDAMDLVLRIHGTEAWAQSPVSPFASVAADAAPIPIQLIAERVSPGSGKEEAQDDQSAGDSTPVTDSFGAFCPTAEPK